MGSCCSNQKLQHHVDICIAPTSPRVKPLSLSGMLKRAKTENLIGKRIQIKSIVNNPFNDCEKALLIIKKQAFKKTQSTRNLLRLLNEHNDLPNDFNQNGIKAIEDISLSQFAEKEDTYDGEDLEKSSIKLKQREMASMDEEKIRLVLKRHFVFENLPDDIIQFVIQELVLLHISKGQLIYREGFKGDFFYIISTGSVSLICKEKLVKQYHQWDCFGDTSLFCNRTRAANDNHVVCDSDVSLYVLDGESFQSIQKQLMKFRLEESFEFIDEITVFAHLNNVERYNIAEKIRKITFFPNEEIAIDTSRLLLIKEGSIELSSNSIAINVLKQYEVYGIDFILLDKSDEDTAPHTLKAIEKSACYEICKKDLIDSIGVSYRDIILKSLFKAFIAKHAYFKDLFTEKILNQIFPMFQLKKYTQGQRPWKESSTNLVIIVVIEGYFIDDETKEHLASQGDIIGEDVVKASTPIQKQLTAFPDSLVLQCDFSSIRDLLGPNYHSPMIKAMRRMKRLRMISLFKYLSQSILIQIAETIKVQKYHKGDKVIEENTKGDTFFIISKGRVQVFKAGVFIREMEKGNCFGEAALFQTDNMRTATVIALNDVRCYLISKGDFDCILKDQVIKKQLLIKMALQDGSISLLDLFFVKSLGRGRCGHVSLVHNKKNIYALKTVSVLQTNRNKMQRYLLTERKLLLLIDHPFIIRIVKTLKSQSFCYFLLEYAQGQPFDDYLTKRFQFKKVDELRFFIACILMMVEYLNKKSIAHRDIKPGNIIIDANGYLKLIDFGAAKEITDYTSTVIGTPQYMAPEVLKGKGYSTACDYWSIGVCAYEIYYGKMPFGNNCADVISIYQSIINDLPVYTKKRQDKRANELIEALLSKQVNKRLCSLSQLKTLELFETMNFDQLLDYSIDSPYKPQTKEVNIKHYEDLTYVQYEERIRDYLEIDEKDRKPPNECDLLWVNDF